MPFYSEYEKITHLIEHGEADLGDLIKLRREIETEVHEHRRRLDEINAERQTILAAINEAEAKGGSYSIPTRKLEQLEMERHELEKRIHEMSVISSEIGEDFSRDRIFDKIKFFSNLRYYMKKKDIKIGQVEKGAGVQKGYMSRIDKPDSATDPSVQFVVAAAKQVDESLDELIFGNPTELSDSERMIYSFLQDLAEDTKNHTIRWQKERHGLLSKKYNIYKENIEHPLLCIDDSVVDSQGDVYQKCYGSHYYRDRDVRVNNEVYWTSILDNNSVVYIVPCVFDDEEEKEQFFEIYLTDRDGKATGVCNTKQVHAPILTKVNELYKGAIASSENVFIEDSAKDIIDMYQKTRKMLSKVSEKGGESE